MPHIILNPHSELHLNRGILPAAVRAADNDVDISNPRYRGVIVTMNVTVVPTIDTVSLVLRSKDFVTGAYTTILASVANAAAVVHRLVIYPGVTAVANLVEDQPLPPDFNIQVDHVGTGNFTYTIGAQFLL